MKEIQTKVKEKISIHKQAEVKIEKKKIGVLRRVKGLTLYQMDTRTGRITPVVFEDAIMKNDGSFDKTVKMDTNMLYRQALNMKNAKRKFTKMAKELIKQNNG